MNTKFSVKQLILMSVIAIVLIAPWFSKYLNLDLNWKFKVLGIFAISLIILWVCVVLLVLDYLKNEKVEQEEWMKEEKEGNETEMLEDDLKCYPNVSVDDKIPLMQRLRELKPWKFEEFVKMLFKFRSYKIEKGPSYYINTPQADWWKDLIVYKDNKVESVQIKKHYWQPISKNTIATFKWLIWDEQWYFITTSVFYDDAKKYAEENDIKCVDYNWLFCVISNLSDENKKDLEKFINDQKNINKNANPKTCKKCWAPMIMRKWWYWCLRYNDNCCGKERCKCRECYKPI